MGLIPNISPLESGKALVAAIVRLAIKAISERQRNKLPLPGASGHLSLSILWTWVWRPRGQLTALVASLSAFYWVKAYGISVYVSLKNGISNLLKHVAY